MKRIGAKAKLAVVAGLGLLALAACGPEKVDTAAEPASGEALNQYADDVNGKISLAKDSALLQRLCMNATGARCPEGFEAKLKEYGFDGSGTTLDLANTMVKIVADAKDGSADQYSEDEVFFNAAYQTILNRQPDKEGAIANLELIKASTENRRPVVKAMVESSEFRAIADSAAATVPAPPAETSPAAPGPAETPASPGH